MSRGTGWRLAERERQGSADFEENEKLDVIAGRDSLAADAAAVAGNFRRMALTGSQKGQPFAPSDLM